MVEGEQRRRPPESASPWSRPEPGEPAEPEPDWAEEIRRGRRARGEHLKDVFAAFDDDGKETRPPG
jgi:hypothetical protein